MSIAQSNPKVVRITEENYDAFCQLIAYRKTGRMRAETGNRMSAQQQAFFEAFNILQSNMFYVFAIEVEQQMVGYIAATLIPKPDARLGTMFVDELWVAPSYRQRGFAKRLMQAVESEAQQLGLWRLRLYVSQDNAVGRAFYKNCGMQENGTAIFCEKALH